MLSTRVKTLLFININELFQKYDCIPRGDHLYRRLTRFSAFGRENEILIYRSLSEDPFLRVRIIYKNNCYFYLIDILILIFLYHI